jgi:hypothetical protein
MNNALLQPKKTKSGTPSAKQSKVNTFSRTDFKNLTTRQLKFPKKTAKQYSEERLSNSTTYPKPIETNNDKLTLDINKFNKILNYKDNLDFKNSPSVKSFKRTKQSDHNNLEELKIEMFNISNNISSYLNYDVAKSITSEGINEIIKDYISESLKKLNLSGSDSDEFEINISGIYNTKSRNPKLNISIISDGLDIFNDMRSGSDYCSGIDEV